MRERKDINGKLIGYHNMIFDSIPDDYEIDSILTGDKFYDWSYVGIMKHLRKAKVAEEFSDNKYYSTEVIAHMALDYIMSAIYLREGIENDRDGNTVSHYVIPCSFMCKHSIELKLKECQIEKGFFEIKGHSVSEIWNELNEFNIPSASKITSFLEEVEKIDKNENAFRYGIKTQLMPLEEDYKFNIDKMIFNTMYLFNVLDEHIICKYRYNKK